jgi:pimeloyl-ACP methyl ester carboxylesterase
MDRVLYGELSQYDPGTRLERSSVPALVVHGDEDDIVPYEDARRVAASRRAEVHTIEGAGHGFRTRDTPPCPAD